ncbi:bifunctional metallophosphatase/5'-nucleotidase [Alicyclobacillus herbarius]|uniref:bifunctional metallophosphatase/5'-nucleotidase n=1 Tax=Alicyclobacillus herbarius TaxID=122960 RepID=UPI0004206919|nr:5'-nucleotidase C-terminal domain-containing protein [Alicyclobacillus herbarius]
MRIHLFHINDVHSRLENYMRLGAILRQRRDEVRRRGEPALTFDLGDLVDRVRPESEGTLGEVNAALLAALGCDAWVFGNNEGLTVPVEVWPRLFERSETKILVANLERSDGGRFSFIQERAVFVAGSVRIGVFGLTPDYPKPYEFLAANPLEPFAAAAHQVQQLKAEGCQIIIALSHLGLYADRQLALEVPGIDVILGGHTHHFMQAPERVGKTSIFQVGKHALAFGHTQITWDETVGRVVEVASETVPVDVDGPLDQAMLSAYRGWLPVAEQALSGVITELPQPLAVAYDRESDFANLLVDSLYHEYPCDLAVMMAGALTASLLSGPVTRRHTLAACSTPTRPLFMTLSGADIWKVLEKSLRVEFHLRPGIGFGFRGAVVGWLAIAGGQVEVAMQPEGPAIRSIQIGGRPLHREQDYRIITCEYLWLSPVFEEMQRGRDIQVMPPLVRELLQKYLADPACVQAARRPRYRVQDAGAPTVRPALDSHS